MTTNHKHEWHLASDYCIHCGLSRIHELDVPYPCHRDEKIIAISHLTRAVGDLFGHVLRTSTKDNNSNSK
jgi:hypothetical protein